jgi:hypothetical protein
MALTRSNQRQPDEGRLHVLYRIDARRAEMVHEKTSGHGSRVYTTQKTAVLFPATRVFSPTAGEPWADVSGKRPSAMNHPPVLPVLHDMVRARPTGQQGNLWLA